MTRREPPWADLDAGILSTVRLLWDAGFQPTDSGDGISKRDSGMEGVLSMPHVVLTVQVDELIAQTDAVAATLRAAGYNLNALTGWHVEGTYSGGVALVIAYGPEAG